MEYLRSAISALVRTVLDLNVNSSALEGLQDVDTLSVNDIIKDAVPRAARMVIEAAPHYLLDRGEAFATSVKWQTQIGTGMGWIQLPDDFLRLVTFQLSDWSYACIEAITEDNPLYHQMKSRYPGIVGNVQRPVTAIVHQPIGLTLEFYVGNSSASNIQIKRARYIPMPRWIPTQTDDLQIKIPEKLLDATVYQTAYLVSQSLGDDAAAARFAKVTEEMLK